MAPKEPRDDNVTVAEPRARRTQAAGAAAGAGGSGAPGGVSTIKGARKQVMTEFRANYTRTHRAVEVTSATLFFVALAFHLRVLVAGVTASNWVVLVLATVLSMAAADVVSGIVHWAADTWGDMDVPIVGKSLIRSFREHHVDPTEICNHDFFETNGDTCTVVLPVFVLLFLMDAHASKWHLLGYAFMVGLATWSVFTNQFHKWAHSPSVNPVVGFFQRTGLILGTANHKVHHARPFDEYYCITTGWMNEPLHAIGFWRILERTITAVTGAVPRSDDYMCAKKYLNLPEGYQWR